MKAFEIFKAGKHTDSHGVTKDFTLDDLQKIVNNYNAKYPEHEAPIVIGHPKTNAPAYGWIEKLELAGEKILAYPKQVVKEFEEAVKQGLFKKRSISLYPDLTLRHVGFLGAVPPAVKGLADLQFADSDYNEFEFGYDSSNTENEIAELKTKIIEYEEKIKQLNEYAADNAKLKKALEFAQITKQQAEENLNQLSLKLRKIEFQQYLNEKVAFGSLTPAQAEKVGMLLEVLDTIDLKEADDKSKFYEFSDGKKANPIQLIKDFVELLPKQISKPPKEADRNNHGTDFSAELELANRIAESINPNK